MSSPQPVEETLTEKMHRVMKDEPDLVFSLEVNLFGGRPFIRVSKPGATPRSKLVDLLPVILGDESMKHSDILEMLVHVLREAGR